MAYKSPNRNARFHPNSNLQVTITAHMSSPSHIQFVKEHLKLHDQVSLEISTTMVEIFRIKYIENYVPVSHDHLGTGIVDSFREQELKNLEARLLWLRSQRDTHGSFAGLPEYAYDD